MDEKLTHSPASDYVRGQIAVRGIVHDKNCMRISRGKINGILNRTQLLVVFVELTKACDVRLQII